MTGGILNSALLSIGRDGALLGVTFTASLLFFALLIPVVSLYGIVAASWLHVLVNLVWCGGCVYFFAKAVNLHMKPKIPDDVEDLSL